MRELVKNVKLAYKVDLKAHKAVYRFKGDSNSKNAIERDEMALAILDLLPDDLLLIGDGTPSQKAKMNFGTLCECALNYLMSDRKALKVAKSGADYDIEIDGVEYEIKTCVNGSYFNTPVHSYDFDVILVNTYGIYLIPKDKISAYEGKRGKLPHKDIPELAHFTELEKLFKFYGK